MSKNQEQQDSRWLLFWIFFTPDRWRKIEAEALLAGPLKTLSAFSLNQLKDRDWGRRLLRQNLIGLPLVLIAIVGITLSIVVPLSVESSLMMRMANEVLIEIPAGWVNGLAFGISFALIGALLFSMFHSVAIAVAVVAIGILLFGSAWGLSWDFGAIAIFGFGGGLVGRVALGIVPQDQAPAKSIGLQIATVFIGVIVGIIILLIVTTLPVVLMRGNVEETGLQFGLIYGTILGLSSSLVFVLINGVQIGFDRQRIRKAVLVVVPGCMLIGTLFGARSFLIEDLVVSIVIGMQTAIVAFTLFLISNHFAALLGGPRAGAIAAGIASGAGGVLAFALSFNPGSRQGNWGTIALIGIAGTVLGLTTMFWRPILTYPFLLIWNLILVRQEEKEIDTTGRRMQRHSAFWDQHQWIPLVGLNDYLLLLLEREPELGPVSYTHLTLPTKA